MFAAFIILAVLYIVTFGLFAAVFILFLNRAFKSESPKRTAKTPVSEEQAREIRRRQRELLNFLNFAGDVMPDADEERQDR